MAAALPPRAVELLADAFVGEVVERLPELQASIAAGLERDDRDALRVALRHVHTLASSAVVVGEGEIALLARRCEERLVRVLAEPDLDFTALSEAAMDVEQLAVLLGPWLDRGEALR